MTPKSTLETIPFSSEALHAVIAEAIIAERRVRDYPAPLVTSTLAKGLH
jgi:hypothetical protein